MVTIENVNKRDILKLKKLGFLEQAAKQHELVRMKGSCTAILYKTGKLLLQGDDAVVKNIAKVFDYLSGPSFTGRAIGTDESLKGDTFGGLVVASFFADDEIREKIKEMGVKDSKSLNNAEITQLAQNLIREFPMNYYVKTVFPREYNKLTQTMNVTKILNKFHLECYRKLKKAAIHIVDKYPGCAVGDIAETKAESKYYEVAAASIIARYFAMRQIRELEQKAGLFIPLGSTHVEDALLQLRKKSLNPVDFVKMHFKNVQRFYS